MITDGLLLVDKPDGMTSHDVVGFCRRRLSRKDIGHAGTLDPMATGILVLLVGKATKLSDFILNGDKAYEATVRLGVVTDSDDVTGAVTSQWDGELPDEDLIRKTVAEMSGELELQVPSYSAIKVKGKKLYEKARRGEDFTPPVRKMIFKSVEFLGVDQAEVRVRFSCSKGSYVRSWAKELGSRLECGGTLRSLRRTISMPYDVAPAITLKSLEDMDSEQVSTHKAWVPLSQTLPDWPLVKVDGHDEKLIRNGQLSRSLERYLELEFSSIEGLKGVKVTSKKSAQLVSLVDFIPPYKFKIRRVFPNQ